MLPFVAHTLTFCTFDVNLGDTSRNGIKASCKYDNVELMRLSVFCLDALRYQLDNIVLSHVYQLDIVLIETFKIVLF
jgi:hypothetical protein